MGWAGGGSNLGRTMLNHISKIISISHCLDISYVFLYVIFRPVIFIDAIKTVTLFITYTTCNNFIFIFNLEKGVTIQFRQVKQVLNFDSYK